jgi:two-component system sensor histidine kinase HydH
VALAISWGVIVIVGALHPVVGFLPILLLPAVILVERYAGLGPAVLATVVCTGGALLQMRRPSEVPEEIHSLSNLLVFPLVAAILLYVMEGRRKQKKLGHERQVELSILLESMPEAVLIFDRQGNLIDCNGAAVSFSGLKRKELLGLPLRELARHLGARADDKPIEFPRLAVTRTLRGETVRNERRVFHPPPDHNRIEAMVSASPMHGEDGEISGAVVVVRDITEVSQLQQRIADTERHLAIGQMAAGIAHDFNNVLDTIAQATAVLELRSGQKEEDRKVVLAMIRNAVRRGVEIITRVQEYIRGGTGQQMPVDVRQLMEEALELTRPLWRSKRNLSVNRELKPVTAPVLANAADLRRVFANLIINALQAMPEGGQLTLHCEENGGSVVAWVRDTGVGITPEQQKKIFLPYYTTKTTGTGLGLSIVQKILLSQHGRLSFSSEPGKGSTFKVELPVMQAQERSKTAA